MRANRERGDHGIENASSCSGPNGEGAGLWRAYSEGAFSLLELHKRLALAEYEAMGNWRWLDETGPEARTSFANDDEEKAYRRERWKAALARASNRTQLWELEWLWCWALTVEGDDERFARIEAKVVSHEPRAVTLWNARRDRHARWEREGENPGDAHRYEACPWCEWRWARGRPPETA